MTVQTLRTLAALRRLRHVQTDVARRALAEALAAAAALADRDAALGCLADSARTVPGEYDRDALAAFIARVRAERGQLTDAMRAAEVRTESARASLTSGRLAETAADEAVGRIKNALEIERDRRSQAMLEDVARAIRRRSRKP